MSKAGEYGNPLQKFKLVFLGEQSGQLVLKTAFIYMYRQTGWAGLTVDQLIVQAGTEICTRLRTVITYIYYS
jgi:hypothetical protein